MYAMYVVADESLSWGLSQFPHGHDWSYIIPALQI